MTSSDNEILVRIYEGQVQIIQRLDKVEDTQAVIINRLDVVETEQKKQHTAIQGVQTEQQVTNGKLDMMTHMVYWGVAVIGLFLGFVAWLRPRDSQTYNKPSRSELKDLMRDVVREMLPELKS